jgi:hypothetical protein
MAGQARPAARHAGSQDSHVADGRQGHDGGEDEGHHTDRAKRDAAGGKARVVKGLDAAHEGAEREPDHDQQRDTIDRPRPWRHGADGRQRRADKVGRHEADEHIPVGGTLEKPQERGAEAHDEHGVDEQQPAAAVDGPALLHDQSDGAENHGEPACGNVDR